MGHQVGYARLRFAALLKYNDYYPWGTLGVNPETWKAADPRNENVRNSSSNVRERTLP